ncbi:MAG: tetratricopeptide repeat protein [Gemmatimonadota bacterium]|nr:tetratricopeptide repeat protein [Gemmatimonadota bacterium]
MSAFLRLAATATTLSLLLVAAPTFAQEIAVPDSVTPEKVRAGSVLFNQGSCTFCHAPAGRGLGRNGPDLSDAEWLHSEGDYEGIFHTIWWGVERDELAADPPFRFEMHPRGGMPWTRPQTHQVAAYVWTISRPETSRYVTTQAEMVTLAREGDAMKAVEVYRRAAGQWPDQPLLSERGVNALGYERIGSEDVDGAIALFELNTELHPDSWNAWDSLAEGHMIAGNRERAIELYRKSLEMNPENENAREKLVELGA